MLRQEHMRTQPAAATAMQAKDYSNRPASNRPVNAKCLSNVTVMSHKLVTITSNHMVRLAQYSAAIWEAVSDPLCLSGKSAIVVARPMFRFVNKLTMTFMLNAAF
jgi:hypothetical protein